MIKAILFDIDNVLVSNNLKKAFSERFSKDTGTNIETILEFIKTIYSKCKIGEADLKIELEKIVTSWNWKGSIEDLINYWYTPKELKINNDLIALIDNLRSNGIKCFIVSDNEKYRSDILLNALSSNAHMDGCFISCDVGYLKNTPEYWLKLRNVVAIAPNEILLIDDKEKNITTARNLGIKTIIFENNQNLKQELAKIVRTS